jgi:hypothetical protein
VYHSIKREKGCEEQKSSRRVSSTTTYTNKRNNTQFENIK